MLNIDEYEDQYRNDPRIRFEIGSSGVVISVNLICGLRLGIFHLH